MSMLRSFGTLPLLLCAAAATLIVASAGAGLIDALARSKADTGRQAGAGAGNESPEQSCCLRTNLPSAPDNTLSDNSGKTLPAAASALAAGGLTWALADSAGKPLQVSALAVAGNDLYLLDNKCLWLVPSGKNLLSRPQPLAAEPLVPGNGHISGIPVQEFSNFTFCAGRDALEVLDKSGDIFELPVKEKVWRVLRPNHPTTGSPDPEYIDMASLGKNICLLDPERNQIWRYPALGAQYFKEVLPWRLAAGCPSVAEGIGIAYDGATYVLKRNGAVSKYIAPAEWGLAKQAPFPYRAAKGARPSRIYTNSDCPLYIVERENNRVLAVDKKTGGIRQFIFPEKSDLRGLLPSKFGFWIINGNQIEFRNLTQSDPLRLKPSARRIDYRLAGLVFPLKEGSLPRHPGVWPGARRLYRYGVHKGTDFFNDPCGGTLVTMGTPVYAADNGKVLRADANFQDMNASKYAQVIGQCRKEHISSEENENFLRGCQVWLDHGNGLMTKYAHLDKVRAGLKPGMKVAQGELLGYVGVTGTGENLPGRAKHPHLHFEVWLDGNYLGFGLTPSETIGLYEDIFGTIGKRGN